MKKTTDPVLSKLVADAWSKAPAYGWHVKFSIAENLKHNEELRNRLPVQD